MFPPISVIKYLPLIDASPTDFDTVYTILLRSVEYANKLELDEIAAVFIRQSMPKLNKLGGERKTFTKDSSSGWVHFTLACHFLLPLVSAFEMLAWET